MQKVWKQIGFTWDEIQQLHRFMQDNHCKNETEAVNKALTMLKRYQIIVKDLEKRSQEAMEWKERANNKIKNRKEESKDVKTKQKPKK